MREMAIRLRRFAATAMIAALVIPAASAETGAAAQASGATGTKTRAHHRRVEKATSTNVQLNELKAMLSQQQAEMKQQQQQIDTLQQQLQQSMQQAQQAQSSASDAASVAKEAADKAGNAQESATSLQANVKDLQSNATNTALEIQQGQKKVKEMVESPLAIHFKGITLTPGGFLAAESVYRSHGLGADINTPFGGIPFAGSGNAHTSEFFGSGRQSRITLLAEGKLNSAKLRGYYEADWLSAGVTSNNNQSNSYTMRMRQLFAQVAWDNGWQLTGGQMWSLATETRSGLENRTEALPMTIDPQYHVGFSWARQYGIRLVKGFNRRMWLGVSLENPEVNSLTASNAPANFFWGTAGNGGGLYNPTTNYSFNDSPDFVVKAAFEPGFGHYEIFAIGSDFRDRVYPSTTSAAGAFNKSHAGGGVGANARMSFFQKHIDLAAHFLGGSGVGRYGTTGLSDLTVHPDGTLALLKSYQGLGTLEFHSKYWDIYGNAGAEYAGRSWALNPAGKPVGYGSPLLDNSGCNVEALPGGATTPGSPIKCAGQTRDVTELTAGFWYKVYAGDKGKLMFGPQYSHLNRNAWRGTGGGPSADENMLLTSFRYFLP